MDLLKENCNCNCNCNCNGLGIRYEQLFLNEKYYDCVFKLCGGGVGGGDDVVVGDGEQIKCHKLILAAASPVFEAMFFGPLREQQHIIDIPDISAKPFKQLLLYIYKGCVDFELLSLQQTIELYYGGEKYLLNDLNDLCLRAIRQKLCYSNILDVMELVIRLDFQNLLKICMNFLIHHCLHEEQFIIYLEANGYNITSDCMKTIMKHRMEADDLRYGNSLFLRFFRNWYKQQQCYTNSEDNLAKQNDHNQLVSDMEGLDGEMMKMTAAKQSHTLLSFHSRNIRSVERCHYKAWCVFQIDEMHFEWLTYIKCNRFITLMGLILNNRLTPLIPINSYEYLEYIIIEITATITNNKIFEFVYRQKHNYITGNNNLNIKWPQQEVHLSPNTPYEIKLKWQTDTSLGAEYPCSILSKNIDGIEFSDGDLYNASLVKGLYLNE